MQSGRKELSQLVFKSGKGNRIAIGRSFQFSSFTSLSQNFVFSMAKDDYTGSEQVTQFEGSFQFVSEAIHKPLNFRSSDLVRSTSSPD
jgi:hypothetical protein